MITHSANLVIFSDELNNHYKLMLKANRGRLVHKPTSMYLHKLPSLQTLSICPLPKLWNSRIIIYYLSIGSNKLNPMRENPFKILCIHRLIDPFVWIVDYFGNTWSQIGTVTPVIIHVYPQIYVIGLRRGLIFMRLVIYAELEMKVYRCVSICVPIYIADGKLSVSRQYLMRFGRGRIRQCPCRPLVLHSDSLSAFIHIDDG